MTDQITATVYLEFIENHLPTLKAGRYRFRGRQTLAGAGIGGNGRFELELPTFQVKVAGERFTLNPTEIAGIFPPNNSLGYYAHVLPHIAFKRDTLPWERNLATSADAQTEERLEKAPWVALLVLNADELLTDAGAPPDSVEQQQQAEDGYVKTRATLDTDRINGANWPPQLDSDENPGERFKVIYVKKSSLQRLLPNEQALTWLAHARRTRIGLQGVSAGQRIELYDERAALIHQEIAPSNNCSLDCGYLPPGAYTISVDGAVIAEQPLQLKPGDQVGGEAAIVVANRLPQEGVKSVIHLVSLEGRYKQSGEEFIFALDNYGEAVPLVSLHTWSFTALTERETFRHLLLHVNHTFLFGIDAAQLPAELTVESLRSAFVAGRTPLSQQAAILDTARKELRDKDHCFYVGQKGAIYNAAGRKVAEGNGTIPADRERASAAIPGHPLHAATATYADAQARQAWVGDGGRLFFVSEDRRSRRVAVSLLPSDDTPSLRLPSREGSGPNIDNANHFLQQGYVPLMHHFRRGGKSVSWYRGPLLAGKPRSEIAAAQLPVQTADELLRYNSAYGMFDTSYAAAWELGRLLCLQNKRVALGLYRWKRTHVRLLKTMEQQHLHAHLPFAANAPARMGLPEYIEQWLSEISLLKGLPFSYLVPDERMLPPESLRFFYLDPSWIACLVDGALSIGRLNKGHDTVVHRQALADTAAVNQRDVISGFLLRSSVVKGWPNLHANAYSDQLGAGSAADRTIPTTSGGELPCLRMARLADNLVLGLFQGDVGVLDLQESPETVHFGFYTENAEGTASRYSKYLRAAHGDAEEICIRPEGGNDYFDERMRVIRPGILASALKKATQSGGAFTAAQFALAMIEGVSRVRFIKRA